MKRFSRIWLWVACPILLNCLFSPLLLGQEAPVVRAVPNSGTVEYRREGGDWSDVNRPKYLFEGYAIRTAADSSATVVLLDRNESLALGADSEAQVSAGELILVSGDMTSQPTESGPLLASLSNKFRNAQRFTTVRRQSDCDETIRPANEISLSDNYPELVWKNACADYHYRLHIGSSQYEVPAADDAELVRFSVPRLAPGEYEFSIEVLQGNRVIYSPRRPGTLTWLDQDLDAEIDQQLEQAEDDPILAAGLLEENGLLVAALDRYRDFFAANVEENELRPLLIMTYANLGLTTLQGDEARLYNMLRN